jgi:nucleotide-binding universal stress UspA family protein
MFPYKRILCAVDFDGSAIRAIQEAGALARAADGVVILFHAQWTNPVALEGYALAELQKPRGGDASLKLEELGRSGLGGANYECEIALGEPGETILQTAKGCSADLIVIATHGRHGLSRLVLGSVAERVVRTSTIPVLTVSCHS